MRQGRSTTRGRRGRFGQERGGESAEEDAHGAKDKQVENGAEEILEVESPSTAGGASPDGETYLAAAAERRAALLAAQFKIEDVGNISQSWGE